MAFTEIGSFVCLPVLRTAIAVVISGKALIPVCMSRKTYPVAFPKMLRNDDLDRFPYCLQSRITEQFFGFSATLADLAVRIHPQCKLAWAHRSPGHHVDGGSRVEIFVGRSATRWLRLYG
jgi:hypothetical protein